MSTKKRAAIRKITLNMATFNNVVIEPTAVNFFYGRNGAGKSTVAHLIGDKSDSIEWEGGKTADDFEVFVYDQNYIDKNFKSFDNLPGVFTFLEENIKIREEIKSLRNQQQQLKNSQKQAEQEIEKLNKQLTEEKNNFYNNCWKFTAQIRSRYKKTQGGFKNSKSKFMEKILSYESAEEQNTAELDTLYNTVYGESSDQYSELILPENMYDYKNFEEKKLLEEIIINSGDTNFATFVRALQATEWVSHGKKYLPATNGKCPFCQQDLPIHFEDDLASCFDREYQNKIAALNKYLSDYSQHMGQLVSAFEEMLKNKFPAVKDSKLETLIEKFKARIDRNIELINKKIREPSKIVDKKGTKKILEEIEDIVHDINEKIKKYNALVKARKEKQVECTEQVFLYLAYILKSHIDSYKKNETKINSALKNKKKELENFSVSLKSNDNKIADLTAQIRNIRKVREDINKLLSQSGFQGFSLREKQNELSAYEVVRENGRLAKNLSEGERNFIAFLYFYHSACNGISKNSKPKVVVIDDPVSSMDSNALFIISSLVRNLISLCQNRITGNIEPEVENGIDQIFILTHNVYFHREITRGQDSQYLFKVVSFYLIRKIKNCSTITHCIKDSELVPNQENNFNPVKNYYAVLWNELKESTSSAGAMNLIRQILEQYFIHLCGYDDLTLEKRILEQNRDKFVNYSSDGELTETNHLIATQMICHLSRTPAFIGDGLHFIHDEENADVYKEIFKNIFIAMGQEQHYKMMMGGQK